ncbi:hypothetical protein TIFTF001_023407 [Ficus carica]|uniref:Uncharacterized protein n=1 Tax=Ficus carica TaxID=3494 RepID=A0AA88AEM2_FICCA|nr:hypothetical protein TIFTF001_023407 [Ficus carica]
MVGGGAIRQLMGGHLGDFVKGGGVCGNFTVGGGSSDFTKGGIAGPGPPKVGAGTAAEGWHVGFHGGRSQSLKYIKWSIK